MNPPQIESLDDLMDLALVLELEAAQRYHSLADRMEHHAQSKVAGLFRRLAVEEEKHAEGMQKRGNVERGERLLRGFEQIRSAVESPGALYVDEAESAGRSSPYKALAAAVHNEERAFALYTYIAANTADAGLRRHAEELALEELSHAALLRAERRLAYHEERRQSPAPSLPPAQDVGSPAAVSGAVAELELGIASALAASGGRSPAHEQALNVTGDILNHLGLGPAPQTGGHPYPDSGEQSLLGDCEMAFAFYDGLVSNGADEAVMQLGQALTVLALDRLRWLYS